MENDHRDAPHLFGFVKIIRNQENQARIKIYGWHVVKICSRSEVGKKDKILQVLRMGLPIVENLSGLQESIFSVSRSPNSIFAKKKRANIESY